MITRHGWMSRGRLQDPEDTLLVWPARAYDHELPVTVLINLRPNQHIWTSGGHVWACDAYDHGPMCRLCRKVF
jgi:hypothetical protein